MPPWPSILSSVCRSHSAKSHRGCLLWTPVQRYHTGRSGSFSGASDREAGLGGYGATAVVGRPVRRTAVTRWGCARGSVSLFPYIQDIQVGWWAPFDARRLKVRDRFVFADQNFPYLGCPSVVAYVPRYFFHMVGPNDRIPDPLGTDFPDLDSAGLPAAKMARALVAEMAFSPDWRIVVTQQDGAELLETTPDGKTKTLPPAK